MRRGAARGRPARPAARRSPVRGPRRCLAALDGPTAPSSAPPPSFAPLAGPSPPPAPRSARPVGDCSAPVGESSRPRGIVQPPRGIVKDPRGMLHDRGGCCTAAGDCASPAVRRAEPPGASPLMVEFFEAPSRAARRTEGDEQSPAGDAARPRGIVHPPQGMLHDRGGCCTAAGDCSPPAVRRAEPPGASPLTVESFEAPSGAARRAEGDEQIPLGGRTIPRGDAARAQGMLHERGGCCTSAGDGDSPRGCRVAPATHPVRRWRRSSYHWSLREACLEQKEHPRSIGWCRFGGSTQIGE